MTDTALPASHPVPLLSALVVRFGRHRGFLMLVLAGGCGFIAALVVAFAGWATRELHILLFALPENSRLSEQTALSSPWLALVPVAGGVVVGISIAVARRFRTQSPVDPIEANAVYGGKMSFRESVIVTLQTVLSSSFGASVGLEAGYTQMSSALASHIGSRLSLRRNEMRMLVGCGAAGAIAAAFNAPFTGAFYAFELIIGVYSVGLLAPLITASLVASFTARLLGAIQTPIVLTGIKQLSGADVLPFLILGVITSAVAVGIMLSVAQTERPFSGMRLPQYARPAIGGVAIGVLALVTPQVLSSGHGALDLQLSGAVGLLPIAALFALKFLASSVSLGAGFRGGLFFSSLLMGALLGKLFAALLAETGIAPDIDVQLGTVVGMASLASGVIGGPLTMTFLVLEITGDLAISAAVLVATAMSTFLVREMFGFSFSTWRLHLRGESIRSAHDVGRVRNLTVASMMRADVKTVLDRALLTEFRIQFPTWVDGARGGSRQERSLRRDNACRRCLPARCRHPNP